MHARAKPFVDMMYRHTCEEYRGAERLRRLVVHDEKFDLGYRMSCVTRVHLFHEVLRQMTNALQCKKISLKRVRFLMDLHKRQIWKLNRTRNRLPFLNHLNSMMRVLRSQKRMMDANTP
jgi:hypothetical protein